MEGCTDGGQTEELTVGQTNGQIDGTADGQTDGQIDKPSGRLTDR